MNITKEKLSELRSFKTASFALWNPKDHFDISYVRNNILIAHSTLIILGLNPSGTIEFLQNFHCGRFDHWYQEAFSAQPFRGAYMTDLISETESDSGVILEKWENDKTFREKNTKDLKRQFELLDIKDPIVVCLGHNTYDLFTKTNISSRYTYKIKHPNGYRQKDARKSFIDDAKMIAEKIESELI